MAESRLKNLLPGRDEGCGVARVIPEAINHQRECGNQTMRARRGPPPLVTEWEIICDVDDTETAPCKKTGHTVSRSTLSMGTPKR